jgi:hypothetical protein
LREPTVSREHAELTKLSHGHFLLKDLGSSYGTSVRQGSDWHLITAENVNYVMPIRIGEFETTVARLLRELDPIAVYMDSPAAVPWATPESRLSSEERIQYPETTHIGWGPMSPQSAVPSQEFHPQMIATPPSRTWAGKRLINLFLIGLGVIATAALLSVVTALLV